MNPNEIKAYTSILQQPGLVDRVRSSEHPIISLCFLLFKASPILLYLIRDVLPFKAGILYNELLVILLVVDFWFTKNVAGRALVGLRWWLGENDSGAETLKIECRVNDEYISGVGSKIFWLLQVTQVAVSCVLGVLSLVFFRVFNFIFVMMMVGESAFNLVCFMAASKAKGQRINVLNSRLGPGFQKMLLGGSIISFV